MKLWISGEVQADVEKPHRLLSNEIEESVNAWLEQKDYGDGVAKWAYLSIIMPGDEPFYKEVNRFSKKTKVAESRLYIDHSAFKKGSTDEQKRLICESLLRSLELLQKKKIPDFDAPALLADFRQFAETQGWL